MSETVTLYKCSKCGGIIQHPDEGVVVHGNIYIADPTTRGGLIGNNFPKENELDGVEMTANSVANSISESVYCRGCFLSVVFPTTKFTTTRGFFNEDATRPIHRDPHNINGDEQ